MSLSELGRRLWHSPTATTWGSLAARLGSVLVVLPFVLRHFAASEVAVWQLFASINALLVILDVGLAPTFSRLIAFARGGARLDEMHALAGARVQPRQGEDLPTLQSLVSAQRWLIARLAVALLVATATLGSWAMAAPIGQLDSPADGWMAWAVVVLTSAAVVHNSGWAATLQGMGSVAVYRRWEVASSLAQIASSVAVVALGGNLLALTLIQQFWLAFAAWRNRRLMWRLHAACLALPPRRDGQVLAIVWPATWRTAVGVMSSQGLLQASGLIYGQWASPAALAAYLLALRLLTLISQFSQVPLYSHLPTLGAAHASGRTGTMLQDARRYMRRAHGAFLLGAALVTLTAQPLLSRIGSQTDFVPPTMWAIMCLAFFAERVGAMHLQLFSLSGRILWHIANGLGACFTVVGAWLLWRPMGAHGFPVALLLSNALWYAPYCLRLTRKQYGWSLWEVERLSAAPALIVLLAVLVGAQIAHGWSV